MSRCELCAVWLRLHFEAGRVLRVEAPHAAGACRSRGPAAAACAAAGGFPGGRHTHLTLSEVPDRDRSGQETTQSVRLT